MKNIRSKSEWSAKISERWKEGTEAAVESHIAVGQMLIEAKAQLAHGEYMAMVSDELPFRRSASQALKKLAEDSPVSL